MFENILNFFKKLRKTETKESNSKDTAKERLHLVLMQDRANVSADFLEMMKQEIIEVIKKYIEVEENAIDVRLTNEVREDGTTGAPSLYANIPIVNIRNEMKKDEASENKEVPEKALEKDEKEEKQETKKEEVKKDEPEDNKEEKTEDIEKAEEQPEETEEIKEIEEPKEEEKQKEDKKEEKQETKVEKKEPQKKAQPQNKNKNKNKKKK